MYKDKEKQKEADRERAKRYRRRQKGVTETEGVTPKGVTNSGCDAPDNVTPEQVDPLTLYSAERWSRLQAKGYIMPDDSDYDGQLTPMGTLPDAVSSGYARKLVGPGPTYQFAVPVPGDPAYEGVINELSQV